MQESAMDITSPCGVFAPASIEMVLVMVWAAAIRLFHTEQKIKGNEKMTKAMVPIVALAGCAIAAGLLAGCDSKAIRNPPITITFRGGVLSKSVLQVNNLSTKEGIEVYVYVANAERSVRSGNFVVPANALKEVGELEINWQFKPGDKGFVCPVNYGKKCFFRMTSDDNFEKWFGVNDIPEVDVALQVRQRKESEHRILMQNVRNANAVLARDLFCAITLANVERAGAGLPSVWPRAQSGFKERAVAMAKDWKEKLSAKLKRGGGQTDVEKDIADIKFADSAQYFNTLLDISRKGTDAWAPYIVLSNDIYLLTVSLAKVDGPIEPSEAKWSILADYDDEVSDCIPVLVSANFPCDRLRSAWDGKESADEIIPISDIGDMKNEAFVVVYGSGSVRVIGARNATYKQIYGNAFNTSSNGYNRTLRYITPDGLVSAVGVDK